MKGGAVAGLILRPRRRIDCQAFEPEPSEVPMIVLDPLLIILLWLIRAYIWVIIIGVILSWLIAFNVVNSYNRFVFLVQDFTSRLTEPALRPIRGFLPNVGGIDISPIFLILGLWFLEMVVARFRISMLTAGAGI